MRSMGARQSSVSNSSLARGEARRTTGPMLGPGQFLEQAHVGFVVMAIRKGGGLAHRLLQ